MLRTVFSVCHTVSEGNKVPRFAVPSRGPGRLCDKCSSQGQITACQTVYLYPPHLSMLVDDDELMMRMRMMRMRMRMRMVVVVMMMMMMMMG